MTTIDPDRLLDRTDAILAARGLAKTAMIDDQGRVCIRGAVVLAWAAEAGVDATPYVEAGDLRPLVREAAGPWFEAHPDQAPVMREIQLRIAAAASDPEDDEVCVGAEVELNNHPETTLADVRAVIARARQA